MGNWNLNYISFMKIWNGCNNNNNGHDNFMNENAIKLKLNINSSQNKLHINRFQ